MNFVAKRKFDIINPNACQPFRFAKWKQKTKSIAYYDFWSFTFMFKQADFHFIAFMFEQADFDVGLSLLEGQIKHQVGLIS